MKAHVLVTANTSWNLLNYRRTLIESLIEAGYEVTLLAPQDESSDQLKSLNCNVETIPISQRGLAPHRELRTLFQFFWIIRCIRPQSVVSFTIKNNLYAGLVCRLLGINFFPNVSGRGAAFSRPGLLSGFISYWYRLSFKGATTIFYQNAQDRQFFLSKGCGTRVPSVVLPGSGVDLAKFSYHPTPKSHEVVTFLMIARVLRDKGVREFALAARHVKSKHPATDFRLVGEHSDTSEYVRAEDLADWEEEGLLNYLGSVDDVRGIVAQADVVVLPSYYLEGTPRALLEAAAMGRPIITTDTAGCRDTVVDGSTGRLVSPRDADELADAMIDLIEAGSSVRSTMGKAARRLAETKFDEQIVVGSYLVALEGKSCT